MGWDRPLQGFFMVIHKENDPEDEPFWSNLNHDPSHPQTLQPFIDVLGALEIHLPTEMIAEIHHDACINQGNKQVIHVLTPKGYHRIEDSPVVWTGPERFDGRCLFG